MLDLGSVLLQFAASILVPWWILRFDESRLSALELSRSWPQASFWCSLAAFGPLTVPLHFLRTRRSLWGAFLALIWFLLAVLGVLFPSALLSALAP